MKRFNGITIKLIEGKIIISDEDLKKIQQVQRPRYGKGPFHKLMTEEIQKLGIKGDNVIITINDGKLSYEDIQ